MIQASVPKPTSIPSQLNDLRGLTLDVESLARRVKSAVCGIEPAPDARTIPGPNTVQRDPSTEALSMQLLLIRERVDSIGRLLASCLNEFG